MPDFLVLSELKGDRRALAPLREAHLAYLTGLKERGKLLLAGRFGDGRGGMYILSTEDEEEARQAWQQMKAEIARPRTVTGKRAAVCSRPQACAGCCTRLLLPSPPRGLLALVQSPRAG